MKARLTLALAFTALIMPACTQQKGSNQLIAALVERRDPSEVEDLVQQNGLSLEDVQNSLWAALGPGDAITRQAADEAFVRMSRGFLLSHHSFNMSEKEYWLKMANFLARKYEGAENAELRKAAAIYLRQIRTPEAEALANEKKAPTLKDLIGFELEDNRL